MGACMMTFGDLIVNKERKKEINGEAGVKREIEFQGAFDFVYVEVNRLMCDSLPANLPYLSPMSAAQRKTFKTLLLSFIVLLISFP
jgi:hypothetical protein